ncbi:cell wall-associated NlpC family hydrolase [Kineococcus xinjiangensis]|uniref:Cell wall-associated NlpC family hydrolase n=1 Tax=Kineococcus xinjiangensis TaxID=512762 RepID=A0A2S6IT56_9ACTN|nr:C40 family peptidase [Kineococcus xinjiangensis]PPK97325.1 cell wall-associated NlpC family hydrolase [Kineococcus xinjiangensis]
MTTRLPARHRAPGRPLTPLDGAADGLRRNAGALGRGTAVLAASSGLVLSLAMPAEAHVQPAPAAPVALEADRTLERASRSAARPAPGAQGDVAPAVLAPPAPAPVPVPAAAPAPAPEPAPAPPPPPPAVDVRAQVLEIAARYTGTPYRFGGTTPDGFDCSGYTGHVFREIGVHLPRISHDQMLASHRIAPHEALPGDLVFMANGSGRVYHVGIYAGDGMMFDSPRAGKSVSKRKIWTASAFFGRVL